MGSVFESVYGMVRQIPPGRVTTYGNVCRLIGRGNARAVGFALKALPHDTDVPWHRVINAQGRISVSGREPHETNVQRMRLEAEGIVFADDGRIELHQYGWAGPTV